MKEAFTFLYLKGTERQVGQTDSEHRPFLYPEHISLVVLGNTDTAALRALEELLQGRSAGTLVLHAPSEAVVRELPAGINEVVNLLSEPCQMTAAGWQFLVKPCAGDTAALMHGLSVGTRSDVFDDCVMSVKPVTCGARCRKEASPDGYGCALGCALRQDYDACRYRGKGNRPVFQTGTLVFGGAEEEKVREELLAQARASIGEPRFLVSGSPMPSAARREITRPEEVCGESARAGCGGSPAGDSGPGELRRYFIGAESELDDRTIADICRGGWNQRPVVLKDGEAICCSGLLKYKK